MMSSSFIFHLTSFRIMTVFQALRSLHITYHPSASRIPLKISLVRGVFGEGLYTTVRI